MDTPGHDIEQLTGMTAGGAQGLLFTTGRGTPTGSPIAPVIKIIEGTESLEEVGNKLFEEIIAVCSGKLTKAEILKQHDFGI